MATRKDVAELAGVSTAVVSYVFNKSNYVSEEKTKRVLEAARQLRYEPNYLARSLRMNRSFNFALVCDDIRSELFAEIAYFMEQYAYSYGYNVFLCSSHKDDKFLYKLKNRKFDGIFIATSIYRAEQLNHLAESKIPIILYKVHEYPDLVESIKCVNVDYYGAAKQLTKLFIEKGYKTIAYLPPYLSSIDELNCNDYRLSGYCDALREYGMAPSKKLVCFNNGSYDGILDYASDVYEKNKKNKPVAFLTGNDYLAMKLLNNFRERGLEVMKDFVLAGMDATSSSKNTSPGITTMGFSKENIARCVIENMIHEGNKDFDSRDVYFSTNLILRESC